MSLCREPTCCRPFVKNRHWQLFCCIPCAKKYGKRRDLRGGVAYEKLMEWRQNRRNSGISLIELSQLVGQWSREDAKMREEAATKKAL